jgi:hypothetical protein
MKKNLRNILVLAMGLMTTVSFAQDWNVDSRTRIDMSGDNAMNTADQRATMGATWGGSDWGIHVSSDVNYTIGGGQDVSMGIYEAYASTDLFGMASMTIGRQALSYGSGALMSTNDWSADRTTWDGMSFGLGLSDMADITIGYHAMNAGGVDEESTGNMHVNVAGEFSGWNVNILYMTDEGRDDAATGIDISGALMGATISASMNTDFDGDEMTSYDLAYAVNDDMSVSVGMASYGDDAGFNMAGTNMDGSWATTGGIGYLGANAEDLSYGLTYNMGGISLSATMHNITDAQDDTFERDVTQIGLGYALGNNASLGLSYATDNDGASDDTYTWVTLNVTP